MKLPLERMPFSGSTSSWIRDADEQDITRISGLLPQNPGAVVAFKDKDAEQIVFAVNNQDAWLTQIREYEHIMKESRERHEEVLGTCKELRQKLDRAMGETYGDEAYVQVQDEKIASLERLLLYARDRYRPKVYGGDGERDVWERIDEVHREVEKRNAGRNPEAS